MSGLQLPRAFVLPNDPRGIKILTEKDVVKPIPPNPEKPLASLAGILGMGIRDAARAADDPAIRHFFRDSDLSLLGRVTQLPHWIAKKHPAFAAVYERQVRRMDERSAAVKKSLESVPSLFGKNALGKADMADLKRMLWEHEGKNIPELQGVKKLVGTGKLPNGRTLVGVNPDFYLAYGRWLDGLKGSKAAKQAMLEIRRSLDEDLVTAHNRMAAMSEMSDDAIAELRQSIGHVPNYFPHHRYGDYFVQAKVGDEVVFRQHFDALNKGRAKRRALEIVREQRKRYPGAQWSDGENKRLSEDVYGAPIDTEAMEQIIRASAAKIADKEQARQVVEALTDTVAETLKARGWGSHAIGRKGVPGFEQEDIARVLHDYKSGLNGWLTKMDAARDFTTALGRIDARNEPELWSYASRYVEDVLRNSDRIDRMAGTVKTVAFAWYLGGSIKTAVVNATQNLVVGVPRLQMDVTGGGATWLKAAGDSLVNQLTGARGRGLTADEVRLVRELDGERVINDAYVEEVRGKLRGRGLATGWNRFTQVMGWPMSVVERHNRASLALAAYRAARAGRLKERARQKYGLKPGESVSYEQAKAFAAEVVRDAHFVYGKSNAPEWLRGSAAGRAMSPMYTFRTFSHNMLNMWAWALSAQGVEGAKFVAKSLGATIALGGLTALPFYATAMALFQALTGDDDDWTETIREALPRANWLRDIACYGVPALAGVNIGGSLKMETPATRGLGRGGTPKEVLTESLGDILGIPYDLFIEKTSKVMEAHAKGNTWRMVEEAAPVAAKNAMQAWRLWREGQTTISGRAINDPGEKGARRLTGAEAVGKALGFQPVSSTKSYEAYAARQHADKVRSDEIDRLTVLTLKTRDTGESGGAVDMRKELRAWNERMDQEGKPHMRIRLEDVQRRVRARRRENRVTPKTIRQGERMREVWG